MDRKWMYANRLSDEYANEVKEFITFAVKHERNRNSILCPCLYCCHGIQVNPIELDEHLVCNGIDQT